MSLLLTLEVKIILGNTHKSPLKNTKFYSNICSYHHSCHHYGVFVYISLFIDLSLSSGFIISEFIYYQALP